MITLYISKKSCEKAQEHQCSHELLRKILSVSYGIDNSELEIKYTEHKKPYIDSIPLSISHSNGICCVAVDAKDVECDLADTLAIKICDVSCTSVGVDIECISNKDISKCRKIAEKKYFESERKALEKSASDRDYIENFCRMWTQKESYCKFTGLGLVDALSFDTTSEIDAEFYNTVIEVDDKRFAVSACYNS